MTTTLKEKKRLGKSLGVKVEDLDRILDRVAGRSNSAEDSEEYYAYENDEFEDDYEDDEFEDEEYEPPPKKRVMQILPFSPDEARTLAEKSRQKLLEDDLSNAEIEDLANLIAQCVSAYGDVNERRAELLEGPYENKAASEAARVEFEALNKVSSDKDITAEQLGTISGAALTIASLSEGKRLDRPIDLVEMKDQLRSQINDLILSGTSRKERLAVLAIMAQQAGQQIISHALSAPTPEAKGIMIKYAVNSFESSGRLVEKLHKLDQVPSHLFVKGDGHNIAHNQQIVQNTDQPNQLLEEKSNANRSDTTKLESKTQKSYARVDAPKQTVVKKYRPKNGKRKN